MKCHYFLSAAIALTLSITGFAHSEGSHVEAEGKFLFKNDEGAIAFAPAKLLLPPRGEGDLKLIFKDHEPITASRFFSRHRAGRVVFVVVIPASDHSPKYAMVGTYTRGTNLAVYYGDAFAMESHDEEIEQDNVDALLTHAKYAGGFFFKSEVPSDSDGEE